MAASVSARAVAPDPCPFERFLRVLAVIGAQRPAGEDWRAYERLKAEFGHAVPGATPEQYEVAMRAIAKAAGV